MRTTGATYPNMPLGSLNSAYVCASQEWQKQSIPMLCASRSYAKCMRSWCNHPHVAPADMPHPCPRRCRYSRAMVDSSGSCQQRWRSARQQQQRGKAQVKKMRSMSAQRPCLRSWLCTVADLRLPTPPAAPASQENDMHDALSADQLQAGVATARAVGSSSSTLEPRQKTHWRAVIGRS